MEHSYLVNSSDYILQLSKVKDKGTQPYSIENGYFIFTMMPSLRCSLNCPHCYLSLEQRRNSPTMTIADLTIACQKVDDYYQKSAIQNKLMVFYWYGGEPTEMGIDYFNQATAMINRIFSADKGYTVKHTVLTSLLTIDTSVWFPFFQQHCNNHFQSSFDGLMRGSVYVRKWEEKIRQAKEFGLNIGTISVVNQELLKVGATKTMEYLSDLGIKEVSFLPFMWNEQNDGKAYNKYAPTMNAWSEFMREASEYYFHAKKTNTYVPEIGQLSFVMHQKEQPVLANVAAQTLFLLPNGDFVLPDYKKGYQEYMRSFGNILTSDFAQILNSAERKAYLRKQVLRDGNEECMECDHADKCVMEFWKKNRPDDDCFGGKKYIQWLINETEQKQIKFDKLVTY